MCLQQVCLNLILLLWLISFPLITRTKSIANILLEGMKLLEVWETHPVVVSDYDCRLQQSTMSHLGSCRSLRLHLGWDVRWPVRAPTGQGRRVLRAAGGLPVWGSGSREALALSHFASSSPRGQQILCGFPAQIHCFKVSAKPGATKTAFPTNWMKVAYDDSLNYCVRCFCTSD